MSNLFDRLDRGRPPAPAEEKTRPKNEPAQLLLNWLQRWPKPTVSSRDIRIWGPKTIRDRESAIRSAQILAAHGYLTPLKNRVWQVVREPLTPNRSP
jgi:hypothetical protein